MNDRIDPELPDDDEALRWAGDEELGRAQRSPAAARAAVDPDLRDAADDEDAEELPEDVPTAADLGRRVAIGVFAVVYLLITVGWALSVQLSSSGTRDLFVEITWQFGEFLALISAPVVFVTVLTLSRGRRLGPAIAAWLLGAVVLIPWPILLLLGDSRL